MATTRVEKLVTETMLDVHYEKNGKIFKELGQVENYLYTRNFTKVRELFYKNPVGKTCRVYRLRDAVYCGSEFIGYKSKGFLASFGGQPISGKSLKYSKFSE